MSDGLLKSFDEMNPEQRLAYKMGYEAALANGEQVTWCKTHFDTWTTVGACRNGIGEGESHRCIRVHKLLSDYLTQEVTGE